jgi:Fe-S cluster biosynthesis and repair protein YggX
MEGQLTAFFLIGEPEQFYGRMNEVFLLNLYENHKPMFVIRPQDGDLKADDITFIPTKEDMVHDAFVILSVCYLKNPEVIQVFKPYYDEIQYEQPFDFNDMPIETRQKLYEIVKASNWEETKVTLTLLANSSLNQLTDQINQYNSFLEVFQPKFV